MTEIERMELQRLQIFTVSQLFEEQDNTQISSQDNAELFDRLQQLSQTMYDKLSWLTQNIRNLCLPRYAVYPSPLMRGKYPGAYLVCAERIHAHTKYKWKESWRTLSIHEENPGTY